MKHLILLSILLLYPITNFANNICSHNNCDSFQTGFYLGARVGPSHLHSKLEFSEAVLHLAPIPESNHVKINPTFGTVGLQFGYLYNCPNYRFILSPEIFFVVNSNSSSTEQQKDGVSHFYKTKTHFSFGANIRLGTLLTNNFLIYAFTGFTCSPFELVIHDNLNDNNMQIAKQTNYSVALNYGLGIEHELQNTHRIRLEAGCSDYKAVNFSMLSKDKLSFLSAKIKPKILSVNLMYSVPF